MKKALSLILALVLCLGLCGCEEKQYNVGETATADPFECWVSKVTFADKVDLVRDSMEYMLPTTTAHTYWPARGNKLMCFSVSLKYIGKTDYQIHMGGSPNGNGLVLTVKYGDGYELGTYSASLNDRTYPNGWSPKSEYSASISGTLRFSPMETSKSIRVFFEVPLEVAENTEEPLEIGVYLCGETFSFNAR